MKVQIEVASESCNKKATETKMKETLFKNNFSYHSNGEKTLQLICCTKTFWKTTHIVKWSF